MNTIGTSRTTAFARRVARVLATGYTLFFFSEVMFWSDPGRVPLGEMISTWLFYSLIAFVLLDVMTRFHVRDIWGVFLAGAVVGWLAEGVMVHTVVESLPFSISFTGLAWHALISVLVGWYLVGQALHRGDTRRLTALAAGLGAFWGVWAIWWWVEPGRVDPVGAFAVHAFLTSAPLVAGYVIQQRLGGVAFRPTKPGEIGVGLVFLAMFAATVIAAPISVVVVPGLLALAVVGLRRNRRAMSVSVDEPDGEPTRVGWSSFAPLLLIPGVATGVYAVAFALHLRLETGWAVYAFTTIAGFWLFIEAFRRSTRAAAAARDVVVS
jgi:hypothetical protein